MRRVRGPVISGAVADCGPDGLPEIPFLLDRLYVTDCPVGALIGKFGRSSAATMAPAAASADPSPVAEGKAFAIGSYCVTSVPDKSVGPLFAGFNCVLRPIRLIRLKISIAFANIPP